MQRVATDDPEDQADRGEQPIEHERQDDLRNRPADRKSQDHPGHVDWPRGWYARGRCPPRRPGRRNRPATSRQIAVTSCLADETGCQTIAWLFVLIRRENARDEWCVGSSVLRMRGVLGQLPRESPG